MKTLSIIIPTYNEGKTVLGVLELVSKVKINMNKEIIIVNDGSTDDTEQIIKKFISERKGFKLLTKPNGGKGSAIKEGIKEAIGDIIIIQDADLEYDPNEYQKLVDPILKGETKVVYGSRTLNKSNEHGSFFFHLGGLFVTWATNFLYPSLKITDEPTCYKVFNSKILKSCNLTSDTFGFCPDVTSIIARRKIKIYELPISYAPRSKEEGKKIKWIDGLEAIWILFKNRFKPLNSLIK